ncbi:MAG: FtsQ-type POTRA domain-containing protein [Verrucomicrobiota bacterium]|nr:FtsQ-type POTRA domain-containing protein [Verrucomicrobiota bacterium]
MSNRKKRRKGKGSRFGLRSRKKSNHSLNVRVNSKKSIRVRRKIFFMKALKWSAVMMLAGLVLIGAYRGIDSFLFESPKFSLRNISYETDGDLPKQRILKFSGIEIGDNILRIDLKDVRQQIIDQLPQIKELSIVRDLPGDISISVNERVPVAWLNGIDDMGAERREVGGVLLDLNGHAFLCEHSASRYDNLPVIFSEECSHIEAGQRIHALTVIRGIRLAADFSTAFQSSTVRLKSLRSETDYSLIGYLNTNAEIIFGLNEIDRQIGDLKLLLSEAKRRGKVLSSANVMVKKNTPVKFANSVNRDSSIPRALPVISRSVPRALPSKDKSSQTQNSDNPSKLVLKAIPIDSGVKNQ